MAHHYKSLAVRICMVLLILFILNTNSNSRIILNRGDEAFEGGLKRELSIKSGIIDGAGFFLKSYSDALLLLQKIEWSEPGSPDYEELKRLVDRTASNLRNARKAYAKLTEMADAAPYNPSFIEKLTCFDYTAFQRARSIDGGTFAEVGKYLAAGDVRGIFARIYSGSGQIQDLLRDIRASLEAGKFPELSSLWRLNRLFAETMLFGQYSAEIFYEVSMR